MQTQTENRAPGTGRAHMLFALTKGFRLFLAAAAAGAALAIVFNFLTPQVFRLTIDSVLDEQPLRCLPFLLRFSNRSAGARF